MRTPTESVRNLERRIIEVRGIVQGVGFRPFIHNLARKYSLTGSVRNDAQGVHIEVEGPAVALTEFMRNIREQAPPLAMVDLITWSACNATGDTVFQIEPSRQGETRRAMISPDVATCADCLAELFDPADRRYRYPFINCTNCGPRFTIVRSVPYDRMTTTMAGFEMCRECRSEYQDPNNRRFHAQPNACPECGPRMSLLDGNGNTIACQDPISRAATLLTSGSIVAVKGLGGYHLACDPFNTKAVRALRLRKVRQDKPFALMASNIEQVRLLCANISHDEEMLLTSLPRPIVLLERSAGTGLADEIAPRQNTIGIMLAYTPTHALLLRDAGIPLVMTSGNQSDEPIAYRDADAVEQLREIADYFLVHNRPIHMRCDDSVARSFPGGISFTRRSRGYAPAPIRLEVDFNKPILAVGGELKNTICVAKENHAFLSHHIGDLDNFETLSSFKLAIEHYCRLFDITPELVAFDLHPEYLSTKHAREMEEAGLPVFGVQHHHAHIASCLADNGRPLGERVIGVALDGTGYGLDGAIWGGEFFEGSIRDGFERRAHLAYAPLPGSEAAIRQPWRAAIGQLTDLYGQEAVLALPLDIVRMAKERNIRLISQIVEHRVNCPVTSSAGRLFDVVSALIGVPGSWRITYEGQAAIELEMVAAGRASEGYPVLLRDAGEEGWVVETRPIIDAVLDDMLDRKPASEISARFHRTMAEIVVTTCMRIRESGGLSAVALSGGTFQNALLFEQVLELLIASGFIVYRHRRVPANDGGLSLGQAVIASQFWREG